MIDETRNVKEQKTATGSGTALHFHQLARPASLIISQFNLTRAAANNTMLEPAPIKQEMLPPSILKRYPSAPMCILIGAAVVLQ